MRSRNLFLKSNSTQKLRWLALTLVGVVGLAILVMHPKEPKLDEAWQSPIEPPGVTIVSQEPQAVVVPAAASTSEAQRQEQSLPSVDKSKPTLAGASHLTPAAVSAIDHAQIRKVLERWSLAWSTRNMDAYFDQYAVSFVPAGGLSRSAWERVRRQRILSKSQITHEMRDLQITLEGDKATANFEQLYATEQTRLVSPKTLRLQREGLSWRIISESSN
jgi:colicin import membrane protein